ncbi:MAG: formate dehydrogenase accessory protein FdhE [Candidatus Omnitrophica bacterium]|nr:formate dehydrogenase accessory protein FdhE [Candidatus Omnitrophota bacterium]
MDGYTQKLNALKDKECVSAEQVNFFTALFDINNKVKQLIDNRNGCIQLQNIAPAERHAQGLPLLTFNDIEFHADILKTLLPDVCAVITYYNPASKPGIAALTVFFQKEPDKLQQFIKDGCTGESSLMDSLARLTAMNKNTLAIIANCLAKPFFEHAAAQLNFKIKGDQWSKGYCPVCGGRPLMAKFRRDDGKRILECSLCGTNWPFLRIRCPFCDNDDKDTLQFFFVDDTSPYRVDVCDKCRKYIKTVDERKLPENEEAVVVIDDIATAYLDVAAGNEKYGCGCSESVVTADS